jgi:hypothetical protein
MSTGCLSPGVKRPGCDLDHPPPPLELRLSKVYSSISISISISALRTGEIYVYKSTFLLQYIQLKCVVLDLQQTGIAAENDQRYASDKLMIIHC